MQITLRSLQITAKQIKHKENVIGNLAREKEAKKKLFSFFHSIGLAKTEKEKHIEIKRKLAGKSWLFAKCHKMLLRANGALAGNNIENAKKLYLKTRELYIKLEYHEKKEIYDELMEIYNKLKK